MAEFLRAVFAFPTVIFTVLVGLALVYWLLMLLGMLLGAADHDHNGIPDFLEAPHLHGADSGLHDALDVLGLGSVPAALGVSVLILWAWLVSLAGSAWLGPTGPVGGVALVLVSLLAALLPAGWTVRRMVTREATAPRTDRRAFIGRVGKVHTWSAEKGVGVVAVEDGGPGLLMKARVGEQYAGLVPAHGDEVLLFDYDSGRDTYSVAPVKSRARSTQA